MARTPLSSALQRSLRIARRSLRSGREPSEIEARDAERVRSRRDFLAAGAAAAVSVSLSRCASLAPASRRGERVIVIGAGIAGLSCAYRLRQVGIAVRVFEAQNRVGGRVSSLRGHFDDGQVAELGGELIDTGHAHLRRLARELGTPIDDLATDVPDERSVWFFDGVRHPETEVIEAFRPLAARIEAAVARVGRKGVTYRSTVAAQEIDRMSVAECFDRNEVSGWFREMLDVGFTTEFGQEIDRLERIRRRPDGLLQCSFRRGAQTLVHSAEHVIVTIPFSLLRGVELGVDLPPVKQRAIAELGYGTNAKLMIGFTQRTWRGPRPRLARRSRHGGGGPARRGLSRALCLEDQGSAIPLAVVSLHARQLRLLSPGPVDVDPRRGAGGRGQPPFRGRALLAGCAGFHGRRMRDGRAGGGRSPGGLSAPGSARRLARTRVTPRLLA